MPDRFAIARPLETAYDRRLLCAAEIVDGVTLERVTADIKVTAPGLRRAPKVNASGFFVWLEEGGAAPQRIVVDAADTLYASAESPPPAPPKRSIRIELAPLYSYPFPPDATALRGSLRLSRYGPPEAVVGAQVRLQWSGDTGWLDAPVAVASDANGNFAAPLRLAPKAEPRILPDGGLAVRLAVTRNGSTRTTDEFALQQGRVGGRGEPFIWDDLHT